MSTNEIYRIGALLRGLTYDGVKGLFVRYWGDEPEGTDGHTLTVGSSDELIQVFRQDTKRRGAYPRRIYVESAGWYSLGVDYDDTQSVAPLAVPPGPGISASRDEVVSGKIALVTGGAQGFGEGMVRGLADAGAFVYIADMQAGKARELSEEINRAASRRVTLPIAVDVSDEQSVEHMFKEVSLHTGGADLVVSNAGVLRAGSVKEMTLEEFEFVTKVDYTGFFLCTKHAARLLALQNYPAGNYFSDIIVISSKSGLEGSNKNGAYAGAKFGTIGLTQSFALELVDDNIKVNALCPGNFLDGPLWSDPQRGLFVQYLNTGKVPGAKTLGDVRKFYEAKVPMKRGCTTEDVMKALFYVVEQNYETGQAIPVTGGQVMLH